MIDRTALSLLMALALPLPTPIAAASARAPTGATTAAIAAPNDAAAAGADGLSGGSDHQNTARKRSEAKDSGSPAEPLVVEKGLLRNLVHRFRFPLPDGWELKDGATAESIDFSTRGCEVCLLRVVVSPGNTLSLKQTVQVIQDQIASNPSAHRIGEEAITVGREKAYTLVKEEPAKAPASESPETEAAAASEDGKEAAPEAGKPQDLLRVRYVTFGHGSDKYYILLRAPKARFAADDKAFEKLLRGFHFGAYATGWLHSKR